MPARQYSLGRGTEGKPDGLKKIEDEIWWTVCAIANGYPVEDALENFFQHYNEARPQLHVNLVDWLSTVPCKSYQSAAFWLLSSYFV